MAGSKKRDKYSKISSMARLDLDKINKKGVDFIFPDDCTLPCCLECLGIDSVHDDLMSDEKEIHVTERTIFK